MNAEDTLRWLNDELCEGYTRPLEELADELRQRLDIVQQMQEELTLVRCWRGFHDERPSAFVDWNDGDFNIPRSHPMAVELWNNLPGVNYLLTVFSTDELIWSIDTIEANGFRDEYYVSCTPYVNRVRSGLASDKYLVHMWLAAEGCYTQGAGK